MDSSENLEDNSDSGDTSDSDTLTLGIPLVLRMLLTLKGTLLNLRLLKVQLLALCLRILTLS
jgi:hypothetical protein